MAGAGFRSLEEGVDTTTDAGREMTSLITTFLDFDRAQLRKRTIAGLHLAQQEGRRPGPPPKLSDEQKRVIAESVESGLKTQSQVARDYRSHPSTISRIVARHVARGRPLRPKNGS